MIAGQSWNDKILRDLVNINYGKSPANILSSEGNYPVVGTGGIERLGKDFLYDGDSIILGRKGTIDRVFFITERFWTIDTAYYLSDFRETFPQWLFYFLQTIDLRQMNEATGVPSLSRELLYKIKVKTPPTPEQEQIAEVLSTIDRAIAQTEAIIAKQQRIKTGLMQDLLTKGIDEHGNIRSEATHEFKDSAIGRIPVEWEVEPCGSICKEIIVGIVIRPAQYYKLSGVPVLRSANVKENAIDFSALVYMSEKDNDSLRKSRLFAGDLVTVRTGYPGTTAVIPPVLDGCNCVDIVISRPDKRQIRSNWLALWINSDFGKKQVLEGQGGLAQQHFNVGEVRKLLVKIPTIEEQSRIEKFLFIQNNSILKYQQHLRKLYQAKTGLMQDLLTGKVRVTNLLKEKEPTSL